MEIYNQEGVDAIGNAGKPIPGQSLTADPAEKKPFLASPQHTEFKEALDETVANLLLEENYMPIIQAVSDGMPITDIAMQLGYVGFREGKWNPDLMIMLMEPLMYTIMALAEKAGVPYRIDDEDNGEDEQELEMEKNNNIKNIAKAKLNKTINKPSNVLPSDIIEDIENLDMPDSLLSKPADEEELPQEGMGNIEEVEAPQEGQEESILNKGQ